MFRNVLKYWNNLTSHVYHVAEELLNPFPIIDPTYSWTAPNTLVKVYFAPVPGTLPGGGTEGEGSRLMLYQGGEPAQIRL